MLWEIEELNKISQTKPEEIKSALNRFLCDNPEIKRSVVINAYLDEKINLSKAAEELGLHRIELENQLESEGIPVRRLSDEDLIVEVKAAKKWD